MLPKHNNPKYEREDNRGNRYRATAPYNFVPLPQEVRLVQEEPPGHDVYAAENYTGSFECTLTTLTPTYTRTGWDPDVFKMWGDRVRDMMKDETLRREYAQFFHVENVEKPLIPGSSLRGMVRGLVEIAAASKVVWVTHNKLFFRTVDNTAIGRHYGGRMTGNVEGGMLCRKGNRYFIHKREVVRVPRRLLGDNETLYDGKRPNLRPRWHAGPGQPHQYERVWVKTADNGWLVTQLYYQMTTGCKPGLLVITGDIPRKGKEFVFLDPAPTAKTPEQILVPEEMIDRFHDEDQLTLWQENAFPVDEPKGQSRSRAGMLRKDGYLDREGDPVFFLCEEGELTFFGRAQMFRLPYTASPLDLVPEALGRHVDEQGHDLIDLSEAIFGYAPETSGNPNKKRKSSRAGRVFFGDATFQKAAHGTWLNDDGQPSTPQILGSAKPTTFQHYLVQNRAAHHDPDDRQNLAHYGMPKTETVIRGHKLYWHKDGPENVARDFALTDEPKWDKDTQHTQIRPVSDGVTFAFRVRFENLRDFELGALLWALTLPGTEGQSYRHKLGMGKPLGLGSVQIEAKLRLSQRTSTDAAKAGRYAKLFEGDKWHLAEEYATEEQKAKLLGAFAGFATGVKDIAALDRDPRIQMLLTMLKWPGPSAEDTKYMDLSAFKQRPVLPAPDHIGDKLAPPPRVPRQEQRPGQRQEWQTSSRQERPSGPPPEKVRPVHTEHEEATGLSKEAQSIEEAVKARFKTESPSQSVPEPTPSALPPLPTTTPVMPQRFEAIKEGMYVRAVVTSVQFNGAQLAIGPNKVPAKLPEERMNPRPANADEIKQRFVIGATVDVWVVRVDHKPPIHVSMHRPGAGQGE